jgi:hypothetical protein
MLVIVSLGFLIYLAGRAFAFNRRKVFLGGEELTEKEMHYSGAHFYSSVKKMKVFSEFYRFAEGGSFDIFHYIEGGARSFGNTLKKVIDDSLNRLANFIRYFVTLTGQGLSRLQTGRLSFYLGWMLFGILILILLLIRGGGGG